MHTNTKKINRVTEQELANAQYLQAVEQQRQDEQQWYTATQQAQRAQALQSISAWKVNEANKKKKKKSNGKKLAKWLGASGAAPFAYLFGSGGKAAAATFSFSYVEMIIDILS